MQVEIEDLVHRVVEEFRQTHFLPGGVVGIVTPGPDGDPEPFTAVVPFGVADIATGAPVGVDTLFEIGSVSKLFTALGLASTMLEPDRGIGLQTPLQDLAPVRVPQLGPTPITLGHLVTHRSGLPRMPGNMIPGPQATPSTKRTISGPRSRAPVCCSRPGPATSTRISGSGCWAPSCPISSDGRTARSSTPSCAGRWG